MKTSVLAGLLLLALEGGCVRTAVGLATAPVKATSWTVNRLTTSQKEADRNRGRKLRHAQARERHDRREHAARCRRDSTASGCPGATGR